MRKNNAAGVDMSVTQSIASDPALVGENTHGAPIG
jgi:hypothetical protein